MMILRCVCVLLCSIHAASSEEGMWLFTRPPVGRVQESYGFEMTPEWLEKLQRASVRFGSGGSGSFVSADGLVLTNHHVGSGIIERLSTAGRDLLRDGFYAATAADEVPCPDLELNVLVNIEDVTARVNAAVDPKLPAEEAAAARRAVIALIERTSTNETGLRSDVVTLYQGGAYHLHRYQRYTDVRLVFAPDARAAAFGGDPDNFGYPRYCLDFAFFRAYENGAPAKTPHFLKWNSAGAAEGELVFVTGHPGRTNRSITLAQVENMRDHSLPDRLAQSLRSEAILRAWADRDRENARRAKNSIIGTQNGRKAHMARLNGLLDARLMARRAEAEADFRTRLAADDDLREAEAAFGRIADAVAEARLFAVRQWMLDGGFGTGLFSMARTLVRAAEEADKPDGERLPEFQEANRVSLELGLFSPRPIYKDLETLRMGDALMVLCEKLGATDPLVAMILDGKSPHERAAGLIAGTGLEDVGMRRELYEGGKQAIAASDDPMIALANLVDGEARTLRKRSDALAEVVAQAHQQIAAARFAVEGDTNYPDATFTLRLSYGVVKGYEEGGGLVPFQTTFGGLTERHQKQGGVPPFDLSPEWLARAGQLDADIPVNFVSTNDITGGNSGSPVVNRTGELVGLIFDTNSHGLVSDFAYTEERGRAVSVHPAAMIETMRKIYGAERVLEELGYK
jgi:hypothetical protein